MKIIVLKVQEDFTPEQLEALGSENAATITVTGVIESVYFNTKDYYDVMEAARMFDAQMNADEDERNV